MHETKVHGDVPLPVDPRWRRQGERDRRALEAVYEAGKILTGLVQPAGIITPVLRVLSSFLDLHDGCVALLIEPDDPLADTATNPFMIAATDRDETPRPASSGALPREVAETVLFTGVPIQVLDVAQDLGTLHLDSPPPAEHRTALIAVPIGMPGETALTLGVLCVHRTYRADTAPGLDSDQRILSMIATLMGQALSARRSVMRDRDQLIHRAARVEKAAAEARRGDEVLIRDIVGESPAIADVISRIRKVAPTKATVLLRGESGTGKEVFAEALHRLSNRSEKPCLKLNCAALSETLLESELFGHEKGSFTGATQQKKGRFELADGGTLFLDEIGEISPSFQAKLLRALQQGEFERVGGTQTIRVDVRLVTATNKDLEEAVAAGDFRADLYFRICVIPIVLPPLRERPGDIPALAETFLDRFNKENGGRLRFTQDALGTLSRCYFPGNVRELENCVQRVATLSSGPTISGAELACQNDQCLSSQLWRPEPAAKAPPRRMDLPVLNPPRPGTPECGRTLPGKGKSEREQLIDAMERTGWVQAKAARLLGLTPRQIGYALRKHGIEIKRL
ncbi:MAG: nif-specific transcriptional activator NifA [Pseudomonadota bacterium]